MNKSRLSKSSGLELLYPFCTALLLTFCLSTVRAQVPMSWPNQGPYQCIGPFDLPMPDAVTKFTRDRLQGEPATWEVENTLIGKPRPQLVIAVRSTTAEVSFLVTSQSWRLMTGQSLPCINEILGHDLSRKDLSDEKKLHEYLRTLDYILIGQGFNLDHEFVREELTLASSQRRWLQGRTTSLKALRQLCDRPAVTLQGDQVVITYNRVTYGGAILRRTVRAKQGKWLEVTGLQEVKVQPDGTFSNPYIGGGG